jgi:hypothetical protein
VPCEGGLRARGHAGAGAQAPRAKVASDGAGPGGDDRAAAPRGRRVSLDRQAPGDTPFDGLRGVQTPWAQRARPPGRLGLPGGGGARDRGPARRRGCGGPGGRQPGEGTGGCGAGLGGGVAAGGPRDGDGGGAGGTSSGGHPGATAGLCGSVGPAGGEPGLRVGLGSAGGRRADGPGARGARWMPGGGPQGVWRPVQWLLRAAHAGADAAGQRVAGGEDPGGAPPRQPSRGGPRPRAGPPARGQDRAPQAGRVGAPGTGAGPHGPDGRTPHPGQPGPLCGLVRGRPRARVPRPAAGGERLRGSPAHRHAGHRGLVGTRCGRRAGGQDPPPSRQLVGPHRSRDRPRRSPMARQGPAAHRGLRPRRLVAEALRGTGQRRR